MGYDLGSEVEVMSADLKDVLKRLAEKWREDNPTDAELQDRIDHASWLNYGEVR